MARKIMGWSKCSISFGTATGTTTMPTSLTSVGTIKDKSSVLESQDGEELSAVATGGAEVGHEDQEGKFVLSTRIIEPENSVLIALGLGTAVSQSDNLAVKTHVCPGEYGVKVEPKNVGAYGIEAPLCSIKAKPGWSESEGNFLDLTVSILKIDEDSTWYTRVKKAAPVSGGGSA